MKISKTGSVRTKIVYPINMLDYFKGISMILIILSHCRSTGAVCRPVDRIIDFLSSGGTLFFQIAAGFGIRKTKPSKMMKKTAKEMLLPYAFCGICSIPALFLIRLAVGDLPGKAASITAGAAAAFLFGTLSQNIIPGISTGSIGPAWFLLALFFGLQIVNLIIRSDDRKKELAAAIAVTGIGLVMQHYSFRYFTVDRALASVLPIYLGYLIRKKHYPDRLPKLFAWVLPIIVCIYGVFILPCTLDMPWVIRGSAKYLLWYGEAFSMLLLSVFYCRRKSGSPAAAIRYIGRNSLLFLIVHTADYVCLPWGGLIRHLGLSEIPELGNMLCFVLRLFSCVIAVRILEKPFRRLLTGEHPASE